ncbi:hypothetical protein GBAR_LOCUS13691 [Geodia barretti]|uniref:Uncharacterized protein n=1 Tax=Geodia barretti TaxID=519541 RepID=A0AA35S5R2_GEOBA|nr:hypothetical protein GBAR_LOCUS13691 [Geodia barretti]
MECFVYLLLLSFPLLRCSGDPPTTTDEDLKLIIGPSTTTTNPTRPEEVNPTAPREEPNDNSKDMEMNPVTIRPGSSTSPDPTSPERSFKTVPLGIWIAAATVALLIVFVGVTIAVCCVVLKSRAGKNRAQPTEGVHYYDYIDSHGIYSLAHGPRTPTTTAAIHRLAEEDDGTELEYVQMASASDHQEAQSLQTFLGGLETRVPPEQTEPYYTIIDGQARPSVTATGDEEKRTNSIEMITNVAYPAIRENVFEDSGEYI